MTFRGGFKGCFQKNDFTETLLNILPIKIFNIPVFDSILPDFPTNDILVCQTSLPRLCLTFSNTGHLCLKGVSI